MIDGFEAESKKAKEHRGVHETGNRTSFDHARLQQHFFYHTQKALTETIGARAIRLANKNQPNLGR